MSGKMRTAHKYTLYIGHINTHLFHPLARLMHTVSISLIVLEEDSPIPNLKGETSVSIYCPCCRCSITEDCQGRSLKAFPLSQMIQALEEDRIEGNGRYGWTKTTLQVLKELDKAASMFPKHVVLFEEP